MTQVESIENELRKKHDSVYSQEQIRAWAHLIQMGKHDSYDTAPNKPFWKKPSVRKNATAHESPLTVSPGKKIQLQGQLVDQLHPSGERGN